MKEDLKRRRAGTESAGYVLLLAHRSKRRSPADPAGSRWAPALENSRSARLHLPILQPGCRKLDLCSHSKVLLFQVRPRGVDCRCFLRFEVIEMIRLLQVSTTDRLMGEGIFRGIAQ